MARKKLKTRKPSQLRLDYSKQYQRVQKAVTRMNKTLGINVIQNPLKKPSEVARVTKKMVADASAITTRNLASQTTNGYKGYRNTLKMKNERKKAQEAAQEKIKPWTSEPPAPTAANNMTQSAADAVVLRNIREIIGQYDTPSADILEKILNKRISDYGEGVVAQQLRENPELLEIAEKIVHYGGNVANHIHAFADLLDSELEQETLARMGQLQYQSEYDSGDMY